MSIKKLAFLIITALLLAGLSFAATSVFHEKTDALVQELKKKNQEINTSSAASISKPTLFFLICTGLIGLLGIRRRKKKAENLPARHHSEIGYTKRRLELNNLKELGGRKAGKLKPPILKAS